MGIVRTHLWFVEDGLEAAEFYVSVIPRSRIDRVTNAGPGFPGVEEGTPFVIDLTLDGHEVTILVAGPMFRLDEAFSFYLSVQTQEEVDHYWELLTADGGEPGPCGWCKDRFGVSWQVVPERLDELCGDYTTEANLRVLRAMFSMTKLDLDALEKAYVGAA